MPSILQLCMSQASMGELIYDLIIKEIVMYTQGNLHRAVFKKQDETQIA